MVGEKQKELIVHETLLSERSDFFSAALKKEWEEGQQRRIPLPDDNPQVVSLYLHWLYYNKLFCRPPDEQSVEDGNEQSLLISLFVFGEKIQDGQLKDAVIDAIILSTNTPDKNGNRWYPTGAVNAAYKGTPANSPLRTLLVDMYVQHGTSKWIHNTTNTDFLLDVSRALLDTQRTEQYPDPTSAAVSSCQYHQHTTDDRCYAANNIVT